MAPDFHQRVRQIFDQALQRSETERLAFVQSECAGDKTLSEAVDRLLRARSASESFLETAPFHAEQIGRYVIQGELGRGAMGVVYDAVDPMIGRRVAVKVISLKAEADPKAAEFLKERLFREARSAGRLFHPGIVVILDVGVHGDSAFVTMERIDGPSLQRLLASEGAVTPRKALGILQQTAAALDYAHQHDVVHRDIKPANIMLQNKINVKVADFGIAKLMSAQNPTMTGVLMGTPSYMSPEQVEGQAVDGRSDQFSLAVLAYELLTGSRPFVADSMPTVAHLIIYGQRPSAHAANPSLPPEIDHVLDRALSRFPGQRFANCAEFTAALETVLLHERSAEEKTPAQNRTAVAAIPRKRTTTPLYAGGIALIALAITLLALAPSYFKSLNSKSIHIDVPAISKTAPLMTAALPSKPSALSAKLAPRPENIARTQATPVPSPPVSSDTKPDPKPKPVPPAFRAQEFYNAAMAKRREGKSQDAINLFREAANLGDVNAMEELGESYRTGDGEPEDGLEASRWFIRAAATGDSTAMLSLGELYLLGDGVPQSEKDALYWFQRAADLKNPAGIYDLATLYENGQGVARNMDKAKQYYRDAAALGNALAQRRLTELQAQK